MTDEKLFGHVFANEVTCRLWLKMLEEKGVKYSVNLSDLTHAECIELAIQIVSDLKRQEVRK